MLSKSCLDIPSAAVLPGRAGPGKAAHPAGNAGMLFHRDGAARQATELALVIRLCHLVVICGSEGLECLLSESQQNIILPAYSNMLKDTSLMFSTINIEIALYGHVITLTYCSNMLCYQWTTIVTNGPTIYN